MAGLQEDTRVNRAVITGWGVGIVVSIAASMWISIRLVRQRPNGPLALPPASGQAPRYGMLEQTQFNEPTPRTMEVEADRAYLQTWGWDDDAHTFAHVPISRAEQLLLQEQGGPDAGGR